jgi:PDZ domain-containing secreted protein
MSNYSKEVIKAAEELIEKHKKFAESQSDADYAYGAAAQYDEKVNYRNSILAAIVSCNFATLMIGGNDGIVTLNGQEFDLVDTIKAYLEELL